jgi:hypothetical protein
MGPTLEHFSIINCDVARKTSILLYSLSYEASSTAFHLGITENTEYEEAKEALMQYFSPVETPEELRTKFHQRFQNSDESLEHFAMELRVLCAKAYKNLNPPEVEDMAKQQFILGARNAVIRERLIVQRPANLKEAIEYGRLLEVANRTARGATYSSSKNIFAVGASSSNSSRTNFRESNNNTKGQYSINVHNPYYSALEPKGPYKNYATSNTRPNYGLIQPSRQFMPNKYSNSIRCYTCNEVGHKA